MIEQPITDRIDLRNATPEGLFIWNMIQLEFRPVTYTPIWHQGQVGASEFLTYNAKKLYLAFTLGFSDAFTDTATLPEVSFYDEVNAEVFKGISPCAFINVGLKYNSVGIDFSNIYFSRIVVSASYRYMRFVGYRLQLP